MSLVKNHTASALVVLLVLAACEALWFGPVIGRVGFYLDDWLRFSNLALSHQDWSSLVRTCFEDCRILPRPLEAYFFPLSWLICGAKPFWHHILNCSMEVLSCWFLYLALVRLSAMPSVSFVAALFFLLHPAHDSTHYWVLADSLTLSMALFTFSLWQAIKAVQDKQRLPYFVSVVAFLGGMFNYEAFAPLCLLTSVCLLFLFLQSGQKLSAALLRTIALTLPYLMCIAAFLFYTKVMLHGNQGFQHPLVFSPGHIAEVYLGAWNSIFSPSAFEFISFRAREGLTGPLARLQRTNLLLLCLLAFATTFWLCRGEKRTGSGRLLLVLGLLSFLSSYTIYAVAAEYTPNLYSIWNRLNYGGSFAAALLAAAAIAGCGTFLSKKPLARAAAISLLAVPMVHYWTMADWGMSKPWILSWEFQKGVVDLLNRNSTQLQSGDTLLLANVPRYLFWSPVFDGMWDFQSMVRMVKQNPNINASVVSERLVLSRSSIKDIAAGYCNGTYPYKRLFIMTPTEQKLIPVNSSDEFVKLIELHSAPFGMNVETVSRWKTESAGN